MNDIDRLWESLSKAKCRLTNLPVDPLFPWDNLLALADAYDEKGMDWEAKVLRKMYRMRKRPFSPRASRVCYLWYLHTVISSVDCNSDLPPALFNGLGERHYDGEYLYQSNTLRDAYEAVFTAYREMINRRFPGRKS